MYDASPLAGDGQPSSRHGLSGKIFYSFALIGLFLVLLLGAAFGQANVNEALETADIYVNGTTGNDNNSGSKSSPLKTIGAAASLAITNNHNNIGTKVTIDAGTYRESISLSHSPKDTSWPITFEAASGATVIVSGATVYTGFSEYSENKSIYTTSWTHNWGTCPQLESCSFQQEITMRQELVAGKRNGINASAVGDGDARRHILCR